MPTVADVFNEKGLLSQAIDGFTPREPQIRMAEAVAKAVQMKTELVIEAGTGTGKTFAYLVPIFLAQTKTIISTGTKNLQDQLFFKDIPILKKIFKFPQRIELLKGRANYLCKHRLERNLQDGRFVSRQVVTDLYKVKEWEGATQTGDISELSDVTEDSAVWPYVTSTADNCLNQECAFYQECFVVKARQRALSADIVIVNHHLFFADMALQVEGFGELLPGADAIIFDEAHHLPEIASQFFSTSLTGRQFLELARDTEAEILISAKDMRTVVEITDHLQMAIHAMRAAMGLELRRAAWNPSVELQEAIEKVKSLLQQLENQLAAMASRSKGLENCWRRTVQLIELFDNLTRDAPQDTIHWFETFQQSFIIQITPIIVAEQFKQFLQEKKRAFVFTSATLTVKNNFQLFVDTLGLSQAMQMQLMSPFDYQQQSLLYVPRGLPDTRDDHYIDALIESVIPILTITQGRAFILFTSYRALSLAEALLRERIPYPILMQGTLPKKDLIHRFKELGNAVLLGTSSFWYGVDVRGDALSCVIIDKLPFAAPDDPILKARIDLIRKKGEDPFYSYQLPHAILALKQGAGRLIRDNEDRGVLVICDPRLVGSRYGSAFLQSLPDMPRTRNLDKVSEFFYEAISV